MINPDAAHYIGRVLESNLNGHVALGAFKKKASYAADSDGSPMKEYLVSNDGDTYSSSAAGKMKRPFVNVLVVDGPVTRNGGACSYGSIEHRDIMLSAAENPNCRGHVFVINTPGGSAWAINDYKQAISYARAKGQPVYAFIDGMCASAGMYLASQCDRRFYMHPKDEVGCIGVMAAFYTEKPGSFNKYTNETYNELYDPESFDKNKMIRDVAVDGDSKAIIDELAELGKVFRADVLAACPNATAEHLHGRVFPAEEVTGILVDEQSTLAEVIERCYNSQSVSESTNNNIQSMDEKYLPLAQACGVEELVIDAEGTHLAPALIDNLLESINSQTAAAAHLAEAHSAEVGGCNDRIAELQIRLEKASGELAEAQQKLADSEAMIKSLTEAPAPAANQSPASNGTGAACAEIDTMPAYDPDLSPEENARLRDEWKSANGLL